MPTPARLTARKFTTAKRDETILKLRLEGDTERKIAGKVGLSLAGVHKSLERSMNRLLNSQDELSATYQAMHLERLEELYRTARKRALGYGSDAHMWMLRCLQIMEKEAKLTGMDQARPMDLTDTAADTDTSERAYTTWEAYERRVIPIREDMEREA